MQLLTIMKLRIHMMQYSLCIIKNKSDNQLSHIKSHSMCLRTLLKKHLSLSEKTCKNETVYNLTSPIGYYMIITISYPNTKLDS